MASDQVLPLPDSDNVDVSNKTKEGRGSMIPLLLDGGSMTVTVCGYLTPAIVLLTVINNVMVCVILLRRTMRNATNTVLVGMAVADTLTGLLPLPHYVHFYTTGRYRDWVPYNWCVTYSALTDHLPTACHTASIWLTVTLAFHRYNVAQLPYICMQHSCTLSVTNTFLSKNRGPIISICFAVSLY